MNKRGVSIIFLTASIIAATIVSFIFITNAYGFGTGDFIYKKHLADDQAWMVNTIAASPGDVEVTYRTDASEYILYFHDSKVEAYKPNLEMFKSERNYVLNEKSKLNKKLVKPENVVYSYKENEISVK